MGVLRLVGRLVLGRRLPLIQGDVAVSRISGKVAIHRDRWGIPTIEANSAHDGWFGLGFCHGQDRTTQLEMQLRLCRGTLSELIGATGLPIDRLMRRLGLGQSAEQQLDLLAPEYRDILEAYVEGINAAQVHGLPQKPHEFALLRTQPTPWMPADVLAFTKLNSFLLAANWDVELARLRILLDAGPDALAALDPTYAADHPAIVPPGQPAGALTILDALTADLQLMGEFAPMGGGSNNWVIAGKKTVTGRPIVANDPHLAPLIPNHFYLASIRTPEFNITGATFVGTPTFTSGHNGHIAWGITAGLTDNTDLFLERLSPDGLTYQQGDQQVPCEIREEMILVKDAELVRETVRSTSRGPILTPALEGITQAISMRATWLDARPMVGWLQAQSCKDVESFRHAFAQSPMLGQNVVFAHVDGTIGYQLTGEIPQRKTGFGTLPLLGWDDNHGWLPERVPFAEMPFTINPECGYITTANNPPLPRGDIPFLGADFVDGYRAAILSDKISARNDWNREACLDLQTDRTAMPWTEIRKSVLAVSGEDPDTLTALELLRNWNGVVDTDSSAATVYELFLSKMVEVIVAAKFGMKPGGDYVIGRGFSALTPTTFFAHRRIAHLSRLIREQPAGWFEQGWPMVMATVLGDIIRELTRVHGPGPKWWPWGHLRQLEGRHILFGTVKPWKRIFNLGPFPFGGDDNTPCQASVMPFKPLTATENVPCVRAVIDVGNWSESRYILFGGQSGNPYSEHYNDQTAAFLDGDAIAIPWTPAEIKKATKATLILRPAGV